MVYYGDLCSNCLKIPIAAPFHHWIPYNHQEMVKHALMRVKPRHNPSPSHHQFYRWCGNPIHRKSWVVSLWHCFILFYPQKQHSLPAKHRASPQVNGHHFGAELREVSDLVIRITARSCDPQVIFRQLGLADAFLRSSLW